MAQSRQLNYIVPPEDKIRNDFLELGSAGKAFLDTVIATLSYEQGQDSHQTAFNEGRRDLAMLLREMSFPIAEGEIKKNVKG